MRLAIVGNCQASGLARCVRVMAPTAEVEAVDLSFPRDHPDEVRKKIRDAEHIFVQSHLASEYFAQAFPELSAKTTTFPRIFFPAFHPDNAAVRSDQGIINGQPFGPYNSKIIVSAFVRGLSVDHAVSLFKRATFARLGYLDAWEPAWAKLREECLSSGLDMAPALERWARAGCFMFTVNHPHLHVLSDIAHAMLSKIGFEPRTARAERYAHDDLRRSFILPIFPEIAERFGESGDYVFKLPHQWGTDAQTLTLEQFASRSYAAYKELNAITADQFDVQTFLDDVLSESLHAHGQPLAAADAPSSEHPYSALPSSQVWRLAVADVSRADVDPVGAPKFTLQRADKIATFGSCFAQHIRNVSNGRV